MSFSTSRTRISTSTASVALTKAIRGVCERGGIVIVIAHRPSVLGAVDFVLALFDGQPRAFGKRDEVLTPVPVLPGGLPAPKEIDQRIVA